MNRKEEVADDLFISFFFEEKKCVYEEIPFCELNE